MDIQPPAPQDESISAEGDSTSVREPTPPQPAKKSATKSKARKKKRSLAQQQATARLIAFNQARRGSLHVKNSNA
ncbi:hypothetical protein QCA50_021165 [Cerrena zonata]|uniref:Uncharacterized protein n=1 Tax=Cerrena zonata TaxID=2478898 RepID=A0AAW0F6W1_9APHY